MANVIDASKIKTNNANTLIQLIPKISKRPETNVKDATYIKTYMVNAKAATCIKTNMAKAKDAIWL